MPSNAKVFRARAFATTVVAGVLVLAFGPAAAAAPSVTAVERVSIATDDAQGSGSESSERSVSADGRYIVFDTPAPLDAADTNGLRDVYVRDTVDGTTTRVSRAVGGAEPNGQSMLPTISADGRWVSFSSTASNLVVGDANAAYDIFRTDLQTGVTIRVSIATGGGEAVGSSFVSSISGDGRYVAFESNAAGLVVDDTNPDPDIYLHDASAGTTVRVSENRSIAPQNNGGSSAPSISADGAFVVFSSIGSLLVAGDANGRRDVFRYAIGTGDIIRVSVADDESESTDLSRAGVGAVSADGNRIVFVSNSSILVPGDGNGALDAFVRDVSAGTTVRVSVATDGTEADRDVESASISGDGSVVAFSTDATTLVAGDTGGRTDIFAHLLATGETLLANPAAGGGHADSGSFAPAVNAGGSRIAFGSYASDFVTSDTNGDVDVFVASIDIPAVGGGAGGGAGAAAPTLPPTGMDVAAAITAGAVGFGLVALGVVALLLRGKKGRRAAH